MARKVSRLISWRRFSGSPIGSISTWTTSLAGTSLSAIIHVPFPSPAVAPLDDRLLRENHLVTTDVVLGDVGVLDHLLGPHVHVPVVENSHCAASSALSIVAAGDVSSVFFPS